MLNFTLNPAKPVKFSEKTIAKVIETQGSVIADVKMDGVRGLLIIKPCEDIRGQPAARCYAMSRSDKVLPALSTLFSSDEDRIKLGQLLSESLYPDGMIIDGEFMVKGVDFQTGSGMLRRKTPTAVDRLEYVIYGCLPLHHFDADKRKSLDVASCVMQAQIGVLIHQVKELLPSLSWSQVTSYDVFDIASLHELYEKVREAGHEGLVIKAPLNVWHRGKKVGWWKMKPEDNIDGNVIGLLWGTEGKKYEGKVIGFEVRLEDNGHVVRCDGLTDAQIEEYTESVYQCNYDYCDDRDVGSWDGETIHINPFNNWAIQLKFMERTPDGSVRHPKFDCWRGTESDPTVKS
ncbi:MAG: hypothetical protein ACRCW3_00215 [Metamycoplasmataceae bacterium]